MQQSVIAPTNGATTENVQACVNSYLAHVRRRLASDDYSVSRFAEVVRYLNRFMIWKGAETPTSECRRGDLAEFLMAFPKWKSNFTRKAAVGCVVACFHWCVDSGLIPFSPYRHGRGIRLVTTPRREAERHEYVTLMRRGGRPLRRALYFLHRTGCRPCEMRKATWEQVNWFDGFIEQADHKTRKSVGSARLIALDPGVVRFLRNLHSRRGPSPYIFLNGAGRPWTKNVLAQNLRRVAERSGLEPINGSRVSAYMVRHTVCTEMVDEGYSDRQIADTFGHNDTRMIGHYSKNRQKRSSLKMVAESRRKRKASVG